jgi:hypothetical protein
VPAPLPDVLVEAGDGGIGVDGALNEVGDDSRMSSSTTWRILMVLPVAVTSNA